MGESVEITPSSTEPWTLVLLGRTGNGKSSTGNSILGKPKAFTAKASSAGVTSTCELQQTVFDGRPINVIDTPGLFSPGGSEYIVKEIVKCIDMAKDGIHGVLLVLSVRARFSEEEEAAIQKFQELFGSKLYDYMVVVFTGGDELEENEETLDDYLGRECPEPLKEILQKCENRKVIFDNKTKEKSKKYGQVQELLSIVNTIMNKNGGKPYTNELFIGLKGAGGRKKQYDEEDLNRIAELVESKLKAAIEKLEQQLGEERGARQRAEQISFQQQAQLNNEIHNLRGDLRRAKQENEQLRNRPPPRRGGGGCAIM